MKEFEDQQDAKFEQVEIGNEGLLIVFTSRLLFYEEINPSPHRLLPTTSTFSIPCSPLFCVFF